MLDTMKNTMRLTDTELPEIKDWEVGEEYEIVLTVKMIAKKQGSEWDSTDNKEVSATFEIIKVEEEEDDNDEDDTGDMETYEGEYASKRADANK